MIELDIISMEIEPQEISYNLSLEKTFFYKIGETELTVKIQSEKKIKYNTVSSFEIAYRSVLTDINTKWDKVKTILDMIKSITGEGQEYIEIKRNPDFLELLEKTIENETGIKATIRYKL